MHHLTASYHSPLGWVQIAGHAKGITSVAFFETSSVATTTPASILEEAIVQLDEYFLGTRQYFSLALAPEGTPFQQQVWQYLRQIPFGQTLTYQAIADALKMPSASRAVGQANMHNPIAILIPCHRVIGKNGKLTGYAGGLWRKEWLLRHEHAFLF